MPNHFSAVQTIERYLSGISEDSKNVEIGFYGGSFTALPVNEQKNWLDIAKPYIVSGRVSTIRASTRPDAVNIEVLNFLKENHITTLELGAQSMNDEVLIESGRGHTVSDTIEALALIKSVGIKVGLQMMLGLPGSNAQKDIDSCRAAVSLVPDNVRVYPLLVIRNTKLELLYRAGKYLPLSLDEAIDIAATVLEIFHAGNIKVLRVGLHPSEELVSGSGLIAGPFHPQFRELAMTEIWKRKFRPLMENSGKKIRIFIPPEQINFAIGYSSSNNKILKSLYSEVNWMKDNNLSGYNFHVDFI